MRETIYKIDTQGFLVSIPSMGVSKYPSVGAWEVFEVCGDWKNDYLFWKHSDFKSSRTRTTRTISGFWKNRDLIIYEEPQSTTGIGV